MKHLESRFEQPVGITAEDLPTKTFRKSFRTDRLTTKSSSIDQTDSSSHIYKPTFNNLRVFSDFHNRHVDHTTFGLNVH